MDVESKLELIHQLRQTQDRNFHQMDSRAQILYGKNYGDHTTDEFMGSNFISSFKFRLLFAVLLFVLFFYMDMKQVSFGNLDSDFLEQKIGQNLSIEDISRENFFVEEFSLEEFSSDMNEY